MENNKLIFYNFGMVQISFKTVTALH